MFLYLHLYLFIYLLVRIFNCTYQITCTFFTWALHISLPAHIQFCDCHGDVVDRKPPLKEEVFAHVSECGGSINSVSADPIPLQIRCGIATLRQTIQKEKNNMFAITLRIRTKQFYTSTR